MLLPVWPKCHSGLQQRTIFCTSYPTPLELWGCRVKAQGHQGSAVPPSSTSPIPQPQRSNLGWAGDGVQGLATTWPSSSTAAGSRPSWDGAGQDRASVKVVFKSLGLGRGSTVEQQGPRKFSFREEGGLHWGFTQLSSRLDTCAPSQDSYALVGGREWIFSGPWHVWFTYASHTTTLLIMPGLNKCDVHCPGPLARLAESMRGKQLTKQHPEFSSIFIYW